MSTLKNFPISVNGDTVVGFTNSKRIKQLGYADIPSLYSWYEDDPNKKHLGMIDLFSAMTNVVLPLYRDLFANNAVLEVNGVNGSFTYDLPVKKKSGMYTSQDTSTYSKTPGIDGSVFPMVFDEKLEPGTSVTYDAMYGKAAIVSEDFEVKQKGDSWQHMMLYMDNDSSAFFPADKLKAGIRYIVTDHLLGEYSTQFKSINSPNNVGTLKNEFILGNHRGVETFYTMYADKKAVQGAAVRAQDFWKKYAAEMMKTGGDMFIVGNINGKDSKGVPQINAGTARIGSTLEMLVLAELMRLETHSLLFQQGAVINEINGSKRANEGVWHQVRRGRVIKYSRPGAITRNHLRQAASYMFRSRNDLLPKDRKIKFKAGYRAYLNLLDIFREEVLAQTTGLAPYLGTDRMLPKSPISGTDLDNLSLETVMFTEVPIPDIGVVTVEHDPSLDYIPLADRNESGFLGGGYSHSSYSLVVWDAGDPEYSNAFTDLPSGTTLPEGFNSNANIYYVKPEGDHMYWGYRNGRYAGDKASDIMSSMKIMGREFWAYNMSAAWVRDVTRYIVIELKR